MMALFPTTIGRTMPTTLRTLFLGCGLVFGTILIILSTTHKVDRILPVSLHDLNPLRGTTYTESELADKLTSSPSLGIHPIDGLIKEARHKHEEKLKQRSQDISIASIRYRKRRKRHPPPGFEKWVEYALTHDAIIVEDFWDRIYHDLQPFWAVNATVLAESAANWDHVVQVRDGKATPQGDVKGRVPWLKLWTDLVSECAHALPDVDMPINYMDESRLLVPWAEIARLVQEAQSKEKLVPVHEAVQNYQPGVKRSNLSELGPEGHRPNWIRRLDVPFWEHVAATCSPDSPSYNVTALSDFSTPPEFPSPSKPAAYSEKGYIKNVTASIDPCQQPHLRGLHGTVLEPVSIATSKELFPLFGGSKLPNNNEILIPGAMYLTDDPFYSGGKSYGPAWDQKKDSVSWRGVASGGRHQASNWRHFQRLRLMEMLNGTTVTHVETTHHNATTFQMPSVDLYKSALGQPGRMGKWLTEHADAGFVDLLCWPPESHCDYLSEYFHTVPKKPMVKQYASKFFVDVDGNSFSARYRALILSTSMPIKATIYAEWHDDRLQPWLHYVPMDNTFQDLYGILDYFTRDEKGDAAARLIAESGKKWGEATLRRQDMLLYVWRLLLEFARVCNEERDKLGYVEDLIAGGRS